jgi:NADPH-dependent 2,4-dienoyl-CoA reductase/sulfur reductase-like enzyme
MKTRYDLIIIGAGPAGMAAAVEAGKSGLSVIVLGDQWSPGGQVYRAIERAHPERLKTLGPDYRNGQYLATQFRKTDVEYLSGATVWQVEPDGIVNFMLEDKARQIKGKQIFIATGARERPVPIPGWTLPGVMAATAADVLLKSHGIVPSGSTVLAGSGPLLFLTAARLIDYGVAVDAVLDTTPLSNYVSALPALPKALLAYEYLLKGLGMKRQIRQNGTPIYRNVKDLEAQGSTAVETVRFSSNGKHRVLKADTLLLHNGVVPDTQISQLLECKHVWYDTQRYWQPIVDNWGNSSKDGIRVIGDAAGISGAKAAEASGHLAALDAACGLNVISRKERDLRAAPFAKTRSREKSIRPFLDRLFRPAPDLLVPKNDKTIVCRCEEVTVGQIREALELGALGPNQLKTQTRCGMGMCQARMCGLTVSEIIADYRKEDISSIGYLRIRPPIKPITVEQLSELELVD